MALSEERLLAIRAEAFADDVDIDIDRMRHWTADEASQYFESGGTVLPTRAGQPAADAASSAEAAASSPPVNKERTDIQPQSFSIYCHNTTLYDGTQLSNSEPAPEFIIAELERRTGTKRPQNYATCSLHQLNLHFMCGGL
jgi:hypothetical protein